MPSRTPSSKRTQPDRGQAVAQAAALGIAACALLAWAIPALASTPGGAVYTSRPLVKRVSCIRSCASRRRARAGSTLKLTGTDLGTVTRAVFLGSYGRADNAWVRVRSGNSGRVQVRVPVGAVTGPMAVVTDRGVRSRRTRSVPVLPAPPPDPNPTLTPAPGPSQPGAPRLETGTSRIRAFFGARRTVVFSYRISGQAAENLQVQLARAIDGQVVKTWSIGPTAPGQVGTVVWNGRLGAALAPQGRYAFRLTAQAGGAIARSASTQDYTRDAFDLYRDYFPVRGRHTFGGSGARFGAPRAGHRHQGQDVPARCGTRLVAARGGRVQYSGYHSAAGYYIVIDAAGTSTDYVYMHLAQPSPFRTGDRVYTAQRIGSVGQTGDARGCHLHFELWPGGWYEGGHPINPLPALRAWDSWS